jgi:hypothetical protein
LQCIERLARVHLKACRTEERECCRILSTRHVGSRHAVPTRFTHHAGKESRARRIIDGGEFNRGPFAVQVTFHARKSIKR